MPDLSKDTVTPDKLVLGETAHDASGAQITGTLDTEAIRAEGVEAGKKSEYDAFWDNAQELGNRTVYETFFQGVNYPTEMMKKPKYPFVLVGRANGFLGGFNTAYSAYGKSIGASAIDMSSWEIDTSGVTNASSFLGACSIKNAYFDLSNATTLVNSFYNGNGDSHSDNITIKISEKCTSMQAAFRYQFSGTHSKDVVRFAEGSVIACGDLNLYKTNQSKEGIISTVKALSNAISGLAVTLRTDCVNREFETSAGANDGSTSEEWLNLVATKPNWTISLSN
jgi:hypothetical protein